MSIETLELIETGSIEDLDLLIYEIKEAINMREDVEEVIVLLETNGIALTEERKICRKKSPTT